AQPAMMTPYTPIEVSDSRYNRPASAFDTTTSGDRGITAQAANAGINAMVGAIQKRNLFDFSGITISLVRSFTTSAKGCPTPGSRPKSFTRLGPRRNCIQPMTLRSHNVNKATLMISATVMARIQPVAMIALRVTSGNAAHWDERVSTAVFRPYF